MKYVTTMPSPVGTLSIVADDDALVAIRWETESGDRTVDDIAECDPTAHPVLAAAVEQLTEYFAGTRTEFDLPLSADGTAFQRQAWDELGRIPFGETITYGEQAVRLGDRNKMRAVGAANGKNPIPIVVPCHRVVGADGKLTGFAGGIENKAWLLDHEFRIRAGGTGQVP
ncbi:MAG: methylated-DNA--[protein]-cysteine S-methyltransferase [Ilumatobacter sp.]|nr:methylated-DNA--[protein]-cysteine S-methyltransferase [Ilumatobacter sp.]